MIQVSNILQLRWDSIGLKKVIIDFPDMNSN